MKKPFVRRLRYLLTVSGLIVSLTMLLPGCAHLLPPMMRALNPDITYQIDGPAHTLYLTLDDGPSMATAEILEVLKKYGVKATFFVISDHIDPSSMQRIVREGHALGHHMKTTRKLALMDADEFEAEFREAEKRIAEYGRIVAFRPPAGAIEREKAGFVKAAGYPVVAGTVYPLDHMFENESRIEWLARRLIVDGGIIILHDTNSRGPRTARVLDRLIPRLQQEGYRFELLPTPASGAAD